MSLRNSTSIIILIISLFYLSSCAKYLDRFSRTGGGTTSVEFFAGNNLLGISPLSSVVGGSGILVYALRPGDNYSKAIYLPNELTPASVSLPNGVYQFYAVGWDNANLDGGSPRCGLGATIGGAPGSAVSLDGNNQSISFYIDSGTCASEPVFSDSDFLGSTFNSFSFTFCSSTKNISGMSYGNDCSIMDQSSRFIKSHSAVEISPSSVHSSPDATSDLSQYVFVADTNKPTKFNLYSASTDGSDQVRLNGNLANAGTYASISGSVEAYTIAPDDTHVVYIAQENNNSTATTELYVAEIGITGSTKISPITGPNSTLCATGQTNCAGVKDFIVIEDGGVQKVIYVAEITNASPTLNELFVVNLDGSNFKKLGVATAPGSSYGVYYDSSNFHRPYAFDITPDLSKVIFKSDQITAGKYELFAADIGGAANNSFRISKSTMAGGGNIHRFETTDNSVRVVYMGEYTGAGPTLLYSVDLTGLTNATPAGTVDGANIEISYKASVTDSDVAGGGISDFRLVPMTTPGNNRVVYTHQAASSYQKLRSVDSNDSSGTTDLTLSSSSVAMSGSNGRFAGFAFSDDGTRMIYIGAINAASTVDIFSNNTSGSANEIRLLAITSGNGVPVDSNGFPAHGNEPKFLPVSSGAQNTIIFISNEYNDSGTKHLYKATFAVADTPTTLDQIPTGASGGGGRLVKDFTVTDNADIAFTTDANPLAASEFHSFVTDEAGSTPTDITPPLASGQIVDGLELASGDYIIQALANSSPSVNGFYLTDLYDLANIDQYQIARLYDASTYGRYKISYIPYTREGGNISVEGTGATSACKAITDAPNSGTIKDGETTMTSLLGPAGAYGAANPFVVAIDVYPYGLDCNGAYTRYILPSGLANPGYSPLGSDINVIGQSGTGTQIIIRD